MKDNFQDIVFQDIFRLKKVFSSEELDELKNEITEQNFNRLIRISLALVCAHFFFIAYGLFEGYLTNYPHISFYYRTILHIVLAIFVGILLLFNLRLIKTKYAVNYLKRKQILNYILTIFYFVWCLLIEYIDFTYSGSMAVMIICTFGFSVTIIFKPIQSLIMYSIIFIVNILMILSDTLAINAPKMVQTNIINWVSTLTLSIIISLLMFFSKIKEFHHILRLRFLNSELNKINNELNNKNQHIYKQKEETDTLNSSLTNLNLELEKAYEELKENHEEKLELMGIAAHELKSPLTGILLNTDIIKSNISKLKSDDILLFNERIEKASSRMLELILNFLDANKLDQGAISINLEPINISKLINSIITNYEKKAQSKDIAIIANISDNIIINSDNFALNHIFDNLISNAIKYTKIGKTIEISLIKSNDELIFKVKDQGEGIAEDELQNLFKKYTKLSNTPTAGESSNGLGLYIVKKLCDLLKIKIEVSSKLSQGSEFSLFIKNENT